MIQSTETGTTEIVAYHKVKRKFVDLLDMAKENPDELQICEFRGQNFELIADQGLSCCPWRWIGISDTQ